MTLACPFLFADRTAVLQGGSRRAGLKNKQAVQSAQPVQFVIFFESALVLLFHERNLQLGQLFGQIGGLLGFDEGEDFTRLATAHS